jgi:HK97 gp10 family phage protein
MQLEIKADMSEAFLALEKLNKNLKAKIQHKMVKEFTTATNNARRDAPYRTGTLRRSIGLNVMDLLDGWQIQVFALAPYASFVEFGTVKMKARPFFYKNINRALENIKRYLESGDWHED